MSEIMYDIARAGRKKGPVIKQHCAGDLEYLTFPILTDTGIVDHLFSTRLGGVSEGIYSSLNFSFNRGDCPEHVLENYKRIADILSANPENMVASMQTHTTNIKRVTANDGGNGILYPHKENDIDGLVTCDKGLVLVTSFADCVPLYFVDPVKKAIGLAHSGWRGTVHKMGACMIDKMREEFGSSPEDIYAAIGPSICQKCYEVSEDVAEAFRALEAEGQDQIQRLLENGYYEPDHCSTGRILVPGKTKGKYQLDLWLANAVILMQAGILPQKLAITDICTCHNPDYLFSHRASKGKRGTLCAFMALK